MKTYEFKGVVYDVSPGSEVMRHGGPFDRGAADSWYNRGYKPHYYVGATGTTDMVGKDDMTKDELKAYYAGYEYNEDFGGKKEY